MIFFALKERWLDWRRERRIADLAACVEIERDAGRLGLAQEAFEAMTAEIRRRSPQQVARMERRFQPELDRAKERLARRDGGSQ